MSCPGLGDRPCCAPNAFRRSSVPTRGSLSSVHLRAHPAWVRHEDPAPASLPSFISHERTRRRVVRVSRASPYRPEGLPFESLRRTSTRHVVSTSAAHLHSFFKDEHPRLAGDRFRPGLTPVSPRWSCSFHGEPPRERRAGARTREHCPLSHPAYRPNLSTSRHAPDRSACRLPSQKRLARSPRAPVSSRGVPNQDAFSR